MGAVLVALFMGLDTRQIAINNAALNKAQVRAYLFPSQVEGWIDQQQRHGVRVVIRNFGSTAATGIQSWVGWHHSPAGSPAPDWKKPPGLSTPTHHQTLGPGQLHEALVLVPDHLVADAGDPKSGSEFFVFGEINYLDVFGNKQRCSFRYRLIKASEGVFHGCPEGNSST